MTYGYTRVSTATQAREGNSLDSQATDILARYPDAEIIREAYSGAKERPLFNDLLDRLLPGDTLVVTKLDRFCRTTKEGLGHIDRLMGSGVRIHILNMGLIEDTPMGRLIVTTLLAFAEFEREIIIERTSNGKAAARETKPGYKEGRHRLDVSDRFDQAVRDFESGFKTVAECCSLLGCSKATWYRRIRETA